MAALTISAAAKAIGHSSRSQLYRLINDGRLDDFVCWKGGKRLIEVNGLAAAVREATQQRSNSATLTEAKKGGDWEAVAKICNAWLLPDAWGKPPWSSTRWASLYLCVVDAMSALNDDEGAETDLPD